jgi:putative ABC transport system permease protein
MNLASLAIRNLRRRPMRTALTIVGIALAVGSSLALVALSRSIEESTREGIDELGTDLTVTQKGAPDLFSGFLSEELAGRLSEIAGVTRVAGELFLFAPTEDDRQVLVSGWTNVDHTVPLRQGRLPAAGERGVALIGDLSAETMSKKIGDKIEILGEQFLIVGITKYASILNRGTVTVPLVDLQEVTYRRGQVSMFHVDLKRGATAPEIDRVKQDITAIGRVSVLMSNEMFQNDRNVQVLKAVSLSISIIALAMGVLSVFNTLLMTIQERTREIGIVAAIGWSDARIMASIVAEGLMMCVVGCVLGVALGFLTALFFPMIPRIGDYIHFKPTLALIIPVVGAAFALCTAGSLYPAWRATRMTPAEALQRV